VSTATQQAPASAGRAARNVLAVICGELLGKAATLVFTVVVARELGATDFGSLAYALAFGMLLGTLVKWGFDADLTRRGAADRADLDVALGQALVLRAVHALPVLVLGVLVGALTRPGAAAAWTLVLVLLATVLDSFGDAGRAAATALEQLGRTVVALVAQRVLACVLAVGVLLAGGGLVQVAVAYLLSSVAGQLTLAAVLRSLGVRPRLTGLDPAGLRAMWGRVFLIGVDTVLSMALFRIDSIMIGALTSDAELAAYSVAYRLMETVLFVNWAVSRSTFPAMVRAGSGRPLLRVAEGAVSVVGALLVPYGVLVLLDGGQLVTLLFGAAYGGASVVTLQLLALAPMSFGVSYLASYVLLVQQRKARVLLATGIGVAANLALNLALIPSYGARGAGAATTLSYLAQAALTLVLIAPGNGVLRLDRALALPVLAALPMALTLAAVSAPVLLEAVLAGLVYVGCYLLLARWRDPAQLDLLRSMAKRA